MAVRVFFHTLWLREDLLDTLDSRSSMTQQQSMSVLVTVSGAVTLNLASYTTVTPIKIGPGSAWFMMGVLHQHWRLNLFREETFIGTQIIKLSVEIVWANFPGFLGPLIYSPMLNQWLNKLSHSLLQVLHAMATICILNRNVKALEAELLLYLKKQGIVFLNSFLLARKKDYNR